MLLRKKHKLQVKQKVTVATQLKLRYVFSGVASALVIIFGVSVFMYNNIGNTKEAKAGDVTLADFSTSYDGTSAKIVWTTTMEEDNAFFVLERSTNNADYEVITEIEGGGTRTSAYEYSFTDTHPLPGVSYYRLKQVNTDQSFSYLGIQSFNNEYQEEGETPPPAPPQSNEIFETMPVTSVAGQMMNTTHASDVENEVGESLSVFPIPATSEININLVVRHDMENHIDIVNMAGKLVRSDQVELSKGANQVKIILTGLPQGIYFVRFQGEADKPLLQKFIKQ